MTVTPTNSSRPEKAKKKSSSTAMATIRFEDPEREAQWQRYKKMDAHLQSIRSLVRSGKLFEAMKSYKALVLEFNEVPVVESLSKAIAAYIQNPPKPDEFLHFLLILANSQLWFTFAEKFISDIGAAKKTILNAIMTIEDVNLKYQFLWQALSPNSYIGSIFYVQRYWREPSLQRGSLNVIVNELQSIVLSGEKMSFKINDGTLKALQYKGILEDELTKNFSALAFILQKNVNHVELFNHQFPSRMFYSPKNTDRWGRVLKPQISENPFVQDDSPEPKYETFCDLSIRP